MTPHGGENARVTRFLSEHIDRPARDVYEFTADPANLPRWAAGVGDDADVVFAPRNEFGVLDHEVRLPDGGSVLVPMRVVRDGAGAEVVFHLRRSPGMTDEEWERDTATVAGDLSRLKAVLEQASSS